jgi:uncharacterized protein YecE (DUF72 family)
MSKILIGTCGYDYDDWGTFYPHDIGENEYLYYYAGQFPTVEINNSYYMQTADKMRVLLAAGASDLTFTLRANERFTRNANADEWQEAAKSYITAIEPLMAAGRLEAVLFQFTDSFKYTEENRKYLDSLFREFSGIPSAVEFGSPDWANNRVIQGLRKRGIAYASTDLPEIEGLPPVLDVVTSPLAYFRLEGRNEVRWGKKVTVTFF